jgi:TolB protein
MPASRPLPRLLFSLLGLCLLLIGTAGCRSDSTDTPATATSLQLTFPTLTPGAPPATPIPLDGVPDLIILSMTEAGYSHLYAYSPDSLPLTRLTDDPWDDITPALSPDGKWIAYASRRNGYWDLYALSLETGQVNRLTDTPEYEGSPSWSPDGQWLVYEAYVNGSLDLNVRSVTDPSMAPIPLTDGPATDTSPVWSPLAREVAFVSNRGGDPEVWLADLNTIGEERYTNVSRSSQSVEAHPMWSADGSRLTWASTSLTTGMSGIYIWDSLQPNVAARWVGTGDWPIWLDDLRLLTRLSGPNDTYLTAYLISTGELLLPPTRLPGTLRGLLRVGSLPGPLPASLAEAAGTILPPLYQPAITPLPDVPAGRATLVRLRDLDAPHPLLHDMVDDSFEALRLRVASEVGWDALGSLENAYLPLTSLLDPGLGEDWLYTGRAFSLNPVLVNAGWIAVVREDIGSQTYWRVFLRARAQDGSQGQPLTQVPWDLNSRYSGQTAAYETGGNLANPAPSGYWLDLTALAIQYGWERLPALANWRSYYGGTRFNEFAMTQGLDWRSAMLEIYPPEALITPTVVVPPTPLPTATPRNYQTPTPTLIPTMRPTYTP